MRDPIEAAKNLAHDFAAELNDMPMEAQNWSPLTPDDELPSEDYSTLAREFGEVTPEMERAYRKGFNEVFGQ